MTGENFKRLNRNNTSIGNVKDELQNAKIKFTNYSKNSDSDDWSWNELHRLEQQVKILEYELYCSEYEDNRRRNWK